MFQIRTSVVGRRTHNTVRREAPSRALASKRFACFPQPDFSLGLRLFAVCALPSLPILLRLTLHRWRIRIFDLSPPVWPRCFGFKVQDRSGATGATGTVGPRCQSAYSFYHYQGFRNSSGSLAMFAAIRRALTICTPGAASISRVCLEHSGVNSLLT
jgi:hypothetical protein